MGADVVDVGQQDEELLAAPAPCVVLLAEDLDEAGGDAGEHGVAAGVPVAVVDRLEAVDVDEHDRQRAIVARRAAHERGELAAEEAPVVQARQLVGVGELLEAALALEQLLAQGRRAAGRAHARDDLGVGGRPAQEVLGALRVRAQRDVDVDVRAQQHDRRAEQVGVALDLGEQLLRLARARPEVDEGDIGQVLAAGGQGAVEVGGLDDVGVDGAQRRGDRGADLELLMGDQHLHAVAGLPACGSGGSRIGRMFRPPPRRG